MLLKVGCGGEHKSSKSSWTCLLLDLGQLYPHTHFPRLPKCRRRWQIEDIWQDLTSLSSSPTGGGWRASSPASRGQIDSSNLLTVYSQFTADSHCRAPHTSSGWKDGLLCWGSTLIVEARGTTDEPACKRTCQAPLKPGVKRLEVISGAGRWELLFWEKIWRSASQKTRQMADAGAEGDGSALKNSPSGAAALRFASPPVCDATQRSLSILQHD